MFWLTMKKYPYSLIVRKVIFCACSDLLGRLRQARPDETDHYKTVQVAPIKGAGPVLIEYSLKKRWPETGVASLIGFLLHGSW